MKETIHYRFKVTPLGIADIQDFYRFCNSYGIRIVSLNKVGGIISKSYHSVLEGEDSAIKRMRRHTDYWFR